MKFSFVAQFSSREKADLLILPFWQTADGQVEKNRELENNSALHKAIHLGDFKAKANETLILYIENEKEPRICLLGLGPRSKVNDELLRRCYAEAAKLSMNKKAKRINVCVPAEVDLAPIAEGMLLTNYVFDELKGSSRKDALSLIEEICWVERAKSPSLDSIQTVTNGVCFVRDLVNGNADDVTPKAIADQVEALRSVSSHIRVKVLDKKKLEEEKMGLILAVSRASSCDPYLVELSYQGNPQSKEHIVLIGKGVTYDTGGLALKTVEGMNTMKCDMSGAATVIGAVKTAALLHLKVNVTAVAPLAENAIGSKSYKLGDVYRSASGKTVEVNNTDAEGRLILADAMTYVQKYLHPSCIIDIASLTGSIVVALGEEFSGLFATDPKLSADLMAASQKTGELLWPMPLHEDYTDCLKSDIADLINTAPGKEAGSVKAALFLKEFITSPIPWAHIDFAGPCYWTKPRRYHPTKATGYGVRLLVDFLMRRSS